MDKIWTCADGNRISGHVFEADTPHARTIIAPAMGVPSGFYRRFAAYLASRGVETITFDYRATPGAQMADWGRQDIEAVINDCNHDRPLFVLGHSCGGQLAGLAPSAARIDGMIFLAAQSGYWGHWRGRGRAGMWMLSHVLIPALAHGDYFPARRLGIFPVDVPATVIAQWGRWIRSPRYLFDPGHDLDIRGYRELDFPALVYGFDDDGYAPAAAIDALIREYPNIQVTARRQISRTESDDQTIGHMGFFRERMRELLWQPTADWILDTVRKRKAG